MPTFTRKSASLYFSVLWDLSRTTSTFTPRLCASSSALAMGVLVKLYAWTRTLLLAAFSSFTTASVQPPFGENQTSMGGRVLTGWDVSWAWQAGRRQAKTSPRINRFMAPSFFAVVRTA